MNLTFGICWIEDQASDAEFEAISRSIRNVGFEPEIRRVQSPNEIREFAQQQEHFQEYELILLDLRLGDGLLGNELALQVRQSFRSTPILFYSAEHETRLRKMMADKQIEGVYCASRDRLPDRVKELVSNMSPALNRLAGMRGLAARVVAECDHELRVIIQSFGGTAEKDAELVERIKYQINEAKEEQSKQLLKLRSLSELLNSHITTSGTLFKVAYVLLNNHSVDEVGELRRELKKYQNDVLNRRNTLSHALEQKTENGWFIKRHNSKKDLTVEDFQRYRADFLKNLSTLKRLRELLVTEQSE